MDSSGDASDNYGLSNALDLSDNDVAHNKNNGASHIPVRSEFGTNAYPLISSGITRKIPRTESERDVQIQNFSSISSGYKRTRTGTQTIHVKSIRRNEPLSSVETLPNEIIQRIATELETDTDLRNLNLSSPLLPNRINRDESDVWRTRFLTRYDHPIIDGPFEFSTAYKLRRLVLKNFISFVEGPSRRTEIQLEVLRDLVIETYFHPKAWQPDPSISRNLKAFESPTTSPWIVTFLSSTFPGITEKARYGKPDSFFETIQLLLSHLLLSPRSALAHMVASSRDNYDLSLVYNFAQPIKPLYMVLPDKDPSPPPLRSRVFPNLKPPEPIPSPKRYKLDTNSLLHIRNFWHRHLIDDSHPVGEHTYADMVRDLRKIDKLPKAWDQALHNDIKIAGQWFGNYSCLHPWPKARKDLEERQSCAEDWDHVDPMVIDLVTSDDYANGFWPPDFSDLPLFRNTVPNTPEDPHAFFAELDWQKHSTRRKPSSQPQHHFPKSPDKPIYIRGLANFVDVRHRKAPSSQTTPASTQSPQDFLHRHPFTALRVRGVIHTIPPASTVNNVPDADDKAVPGWQRIVMVMYKPTITYLIQVLEHATEDFGGAFTTLLTTPVNTANIWASTNNTAGTTTTASNPTTDPSPVQNQQPNPTPNPTITTTTTQPTLQTQLQTHLRTLLHSLTSPLPPNPSTPQILSLEDSFSPPQHLTWEEGQTVEYAYAYEGVVLPGGKIMLGRWWRCHGVNGGGVGWEVDVHGGRVGSAVDEDEEGEEGAGVDVGGRGEGWRNLERGPFVFWC